MPRARAATPFLPLLFLALMLARIGNWAVFRVLVPVALSLLSVVFGRELRVAARNVRDLGRANDHSLSHAADRLRKATMPSVEVRVETTPSQKRRVEDVEVLEAEEIESDDDPRASRRHRA